MAFLKRTIEDFLEKRLFQGKVVIVYGARQVGKTTLVKRILDRYPDDSRYFHAEIASVQAALREIEPDRIKAFFGNVRLVVLDEAQHIPHIGQLLKVMIDTYPDFQIIATGSSSFDLADSVSEPLTGRNTTLTLYPFSVAEIAGDNGLSAVDGKLERLLRFGSYPEVYFLDDEMARERLEVIASDYLYKDVLMLDGIKKSSVIRKLLELLALQVGQEVSYYELAMQLGISSATVEKYIDILEKAFVVFRLRAFARNKRKEISKSVKVYFFDTGIRNSLIQNYNPLHLRDDAGALWENFCIVERKKFLETTRRFPNTYFWRTYTQKEVDYIEESEGKLCGYEFKWGDRIRNTPGAGFSKEYQAIVDVVSPKTYWKFLGLGDN